LQRLRQLRIRIQDVHLLQHTYTQRQRLTRRRISTIYPLNKTTLHNLMARTTVAHSSNATGSVCQAHYYSDQKQNNSSNDNDKNINESIKKVMASNDIQYAEVSYRNDVTLPVKTLSALEMKVMGFNRTHSYDYHCG
jgi:hypothetical protein